MFSYDAIFNRVKAAFQQPVAAVQHEGSPDDVPINTDAILAITDKLLAVNRGHAEPDDRDSLEFRRVHTPDKLFSERIKLDAGKVRRIGMLRVAKQRKLKPIGVNHFDPYMTGLLVGNPLTSPGEDSNPLQHVEQARRITQMGPGGVPSDDSITESMQAVHPSIFGFISALEGPECFDEKTEVFTAKGWKFWSEIKVDDFLACRDSEGRMFFSKPERLIVAPYSGPMIKVDARMFHLMVTPTHRLFVADHDKTLKGKATGWFYISAQEFTKFRALRFDTGSLPYAGVASYDWQIPYIEKKSNTQKSIPPISIELWAEFMGWYLSEGNASVVKVKGKSHYNHVARISQSLKVNPDCCERIAALLQQLPFSWNYSSGSSSFTVSSKQLTLYLKQFGFALDKYIPEYLFDAPIVARQNLLDALLLGDGRINKKHTNFTSGSKQLAVDFERLAIGLGYTTNFRQYFDNRDRVKAWSYEISLLKLRERVASREPCECIGGVFTEEAYTGTVYCATVPGGLLLTRRGQSSGIWSGNSSRAGVDTRLAWGAKIGTDGKIYQKFLNKRSGKHEYVSPSDLANKTVGLPD